MRVRARAKSLNQKQIMEYMRQISLVSHTLLKLHCTPLILPTSNAICPLPIRRNWSSSWRGAHELYFRQNNIKIHLWTYSSNAEDGVFWLSVSIPYLLRKSPGHQQAWYWLCRTNNMYCCFRVNFIYPREIQNTIENMNIHHVVFKTIQRI